MYILNAFSLNMISAFPVDVHFEEVSLEEARVIAVDCESAVGHLETAAVFADALGCPILANRVSVTLFKGDSVLIGQYKGPRLPEGTTSLPGGSTIKWILARIK